MVLPLTNSYLLTLPKLGHKELAHISLSAVAGRTVRVGRRLEQRPEFSQRWGLCQPDSCAAICCLHRYFSMKSTTESVRPCLGIMRLGVVARHFCPPSQVIKTIVELLLTQRMGSTRSLCVSSMGALCWLCVSRAVVLCCAVLGGSRSHWSYMSLEAGFRAVFPFYPHYGCVFIESAEENASDSLDFSFIVFVP